MTKAEIIEALRDILDQVQQIPVFDNDKPTKNWLVNNQRKWAIREIEALIAATQEGTYEL